jgi:lipopolysaccharide export system protein LptC
MNAATVHPEAINSWAPQRQRTLAQVRRRSRMVSIMRMMFVAGAAISAGILLGPIASSMLTGPSFTIARVPGDQVVTMINPRFTGRNLDGEYYVITADTARRRRDDPNTIDLTNPQLSDDDGSVIDAPVGVYYQSSNFLELFQDVSVSDGTGNVLSTTAARIYVAEGRVAGLTPLEGDGPLGKLRADTYEIIDEGDRVILRGNVDMTIFPNQREPLVE